LQNGFVTENVNFSPPKEAEKLDTLVFGESRYRHSRGRRAKLLLNSERKCNFSFFISFSSLNFVLFAL
jgi:hypothetical protein